MGQGLKRVAAACGGISCTAKGVTVKYDGQGRKIEYASESSKPKTMQIVLSFELPRQCTEECRFMNTGKGIVDDRCILFDEDLESAPDTAIEKDWCEPCQRCKDARKEQQKNGVVFVEA